jgi:SAM-dependent methyltransferase
MRIQAPRPLKPYARSLRYVFRVIRSAFGRFPRECTVCGYHGHFFAYGNPYALGVNVDALCPRCMSLERHRLWAICEKTHGLIPGKDVLHFAPEPGLRDYVVARGPRSYTTTDYMDDSADLKLNIEKLDVGDGTYDLVICSHVLEHVNDTLAIPELFRIVRPGGILLAMVPLFEGWDRSFEDASKTARKEDRILYFNQHDHVRAYGKDFRTRLSSAGFELEEFTAVEPDVSRYGLLRGEKVFICRKAALAMPLAVAAGAAARM